MNKITLVTIPGFDSKTAFGTVRKIVRDNDEPLYFCHDFELITNYKSLRCSTLSYFVGEDRFKSNGRLIIASWPVIKKAFKKIIDLGKHNSIIAELYGRTDPQIPTVKHDIQLKISKLGARLGSTSLEERKIVMLHLWQAVLSPSEFKHHFKDFADVELEDVFELSSIELSKLFFDCLKAESHEEAVKKKNNDVGVNIPIGDGKSITINININGVNFDGHQSRKI